MKKLILGLFLFTFMFVPAHSVSAHVLVTDETNTNGAILHINPDDDPIAGEQATLYFDAQNQLIKPDSSVVLTIKDADGNEQVVETEISSSLVTANFIFPRQGVYDISYVLINNGNTYIFKKSQRVSRGVTGGASFNQTYAWAEALLVLSGVSFVLLLILAFNRRKEIAEQSKL